MNDELDQPDGPPDEPSSRGERFMRLFVRHERRVYGLILSMVGNLSDADDVMQEATAVMWRKFDGFEPGTDFAAWALSIGRFQSMAHRKRKAVARTRLSDRTVEVIADEMGSEPDRGDERREALRKCLTKLKEDDRKLVELRYEPDATTKSVSQQSGRSIHAVYKALNRIHGALLRCVRQTMAAEGIHLRV